MSVLVTTVFSQGAVFYAGETVTCTLQFSYPLPTTTTTTTNHPTTTTTAAAAAAATSHKRPHASHSRSQSLSSADLLPSTPPHTKDSSRHTTTSRNIDSLVLAGLGKGTSLSSLASSTLSFLTGYTPSRSTASEVLWETDPRHEEDTRHDENTTTNNTTDPIAIELAAHDSLTPRSSSETQSTLPRETLDSRRSSMDSIASNVYQRQHLNSQRLTHLLKSTPPPFFSHKKPEHLLWGFAQVVGHFSVDPTFINNNEFAPLKHKTMYRPYGGGFGAGGAGGVDTHGKRLDTRTTPVFSTPPSILFVDLDLAPGDSKKFTYKIKLPNDLPPSHRGKAIRFNYFLVVGTQRLNSLSLNQSQVVQIPFRVLNHVLEDGSRPVYDLMNPVVVYKDEAIVKTLPDPTTGTAPPPPPTTTTESNHNKHTKPENEKARSEFMDYVNTLVENSAKNSLVHEMTQRESEAYDEPAGRENWHNSRRGAGSTCAQIVSAVTHGSRKAMYDICKNNQRVAQLHLVKTAYRLGEPILGILDFQDAVLPTFEVSVLLESSEIVEPSIALRPPQHIARVSRKCHAEHHSFCLGHRRLFFSLPIPAISSPEFHTTGVKLHYYLKFEFITGEGAPFTPFIPIHVDERHRHYQGLQDIPVSTFDCQIPIRIYGSASGADRALYGRPHTFVVQ